MTPKEVETLSRVGPGTPMGNYARSNWIPALRSARLEAGGAPVKSRLLGENFVAYRRKDGQVGFVDEACPHRGVSLALANNDGENLQCLFHGWKVNTRGCVVAAPLVPNEAKFCAGVKTRSYQVHEAGNLVWVYLGGGEAPGFPNTPFSQDPKAIPRGAIVYANWLQWHEGTFDPNHVAHLHPSWLPEFAVKALLNSPPSFEMDDKPYGFTGCSIRTVGPEVSYARAKEIIMPFTCDVPFDPDIPKTAIISVPIDDETTYTWYIGYSDSGIVDPSARKMVLVGSTDDMNDDDIFWLGANGDHTLPRNYDNFRENMPYDPAGLWGQSRENMGKGHHTGFKGLVLEDIAVVESMGRFMDRSRETLNVTDAFVTRYRRRLLADIQSHAAGFRPPAIDYSRVIARDGFVPKGRDWRDLPRFPGEPRLTDEPDEVEGAERSTEKAKA